MGLYRVVHADYSEDMTLIRIYISPSFRRETRCLQYRISR